MCVFAWVYEVCLYCNTVSVSTMLWWSYIFLFLPLAYLGTFSSPALSTLATSCWFVHSCNVHPCHIVPICSFLHCPPLPYRADMSTPAFSTPPFLTVPLCPLPQTPSTPRFADSTCLNLIVPSARHVTLIVGLYSNLLSISFKSQTQQDALKVLKFSNAYLDAETPESDRTTGIAGIPAVITA